MEMDEHVRRQRRRAGTGAERAAPIASHPSVSEELDPSARELALQRSHQPCLAQIVRRPVRIVPPAIGVLKETGRQSRRRRRIETVT
jgi:hypothetical protein